MKTRNDLKELQNVELEILKDFIKVCDKLNINYFLIGGTLIGAVRHRGFIPWDDDIDVCMLRDDYEKFIKNGQRYLNKNYFLQTYITDEEYPGCFAKIRDNNTTFLEESVRYKKINHGIFIDIFPLDYYHKHNKIKEKLILYKLYNDKFSNDKRILVKILLKISNIIYKNKTKYELCEMQEKMYKTNKKSKFVTNFCGAWGVKRETHDIDNFINYEVGDFEGIKVKIPFNADAVLSKTYGDYLKMPPKEKQISHHYTDIIDTKRSYKEYI